MNLSVFLVYAYQKEFTDMNDIQISRHIYCGSLVGGYQYFGGTHSFCVQGRSESKLGREQNTVFWKIGGTDDMSGQSEPGMGKRR
jgi:hypothetical protein